MLSSTRGVQSSAPLASAAHAVHSPVRDRRRVCGAGRGGDRSLRRYSTVEVVVADCGMSSANARFLASVAEQVKVVQVDEHWLSPFRDRSMPRSAFARLFVDRLIPEEHALYLDGDILVRGSVDPLLEFNLDGAVVAAAPMGAVVGGNPATAGGPARVEWPG